MADLLEINLSPPFGVLALPGVVAFEFDPKTKNDF